MFAAMFLWVVLRLVGVDGFLYQPGTGGQIWDPSVTWWRGKWYAHAMYQHPGDRTNVYTSGWLATSQDGVHWEDGGAVAPENKSAGDMWWKGFVRQIRGSATNMTDDALFIMDHGVYEPGKGNDALRFLTSQDLKTWTLNSTSHPDPRWYNKRGRWDHMYMSRDEENGGFIGFAVSSPIVPGFAGTWPGVQRSSDGIHWDIHAPLNVSWESGVRPTSIEEGGFERIGSKFYLIGGGGGPARDAYSMWVFVSDRIDGPYAPLVNGFRLSGGGAAGGSGRYGWLAAWCGPRCTAEGDPLVSNYITPGPNARADVWILPMRKPIVDASGRMRLSYWTGNDVLLGQPVPVHDASVQCGGADGGVVWLANFTAAQHLTGGVLVAKVDIGAAAQGAFGVVLEDVVNARNQTYMPATDIPGGDYKYYGVNYTDPHLCEKDCEEDARCQAWTYVGAGADSGLDPRGYPVPRCCLKDALSTPRANPVCTSGVKGVVGRGYTSLTVDVVAPAEVDAGSPSTQSAATLQRVDDAGHATTIDRASAFECGTNVTCGVATVTHVQPRSSCTARVLFRRGMFEVYIDDLLAQTYLYGGGYPLPTQGEGRVGLRCTGGASFQIKSAQAWQMTLE